MNGTNGVSEKTIERLTMYRRLLSGLKEKGLEHLYSHQLAEFSGNSPAQVRRDIMTTGYVARGSKGYSVEDLVAKIDETMALPKDQKICLVGIGNLGRAILSYFNNQHSALKIVVAFDDDESKTGRVISGCRTCHVREIPEKVEAEGIELGIITVPGQYAQEVADTLVSSGIKGILNFAPIPLKTPKCVYVDRIDITTAIEKVAYFSAKNCVDAEEK